MNDYVAYAERRWTVDDDICIKTTGPLYWLVP